MTISTYKPYPQCCRGVTLVETVVAIALVATLIVGAMGAQSRLKRQWREANLRIEAVDIAESLMTQWWNSTEGIPHNDNGEVEITTTNDQGEMEGEIEGEMEDIPLNDYGETGDIPNWRWSTHVVHDQHLKDNNLEIVQLQVFPPPSQRSKNAAVKLDIIIPAQSEDDEEKDNEKDEEKDKTATANDEQTDDEQNRIKTPLFEPLIRYNTDEKSNYGVWLR